MEAAQAHQVQFIQKYNKDVAKLNSEKDKIQKDKEELQALTEVQHVQLQERDSLYKEYQIKCAEHLTRLENQIVTSSQSSGKQMVGGHSHQPYKSRGQLG